MRAYLVLKLEEPVEVRRSFTVKVCDPKSTVAATPFTPKVRVATLYEAAGAVTLNPSGMVASSAVDEGNPLPPHVAAAHQTTKSRAKRDEKNQFSITYRHPRRRSLWPCTTRHAPRPAAAKPGTARTDPSRSSVAPPFGRSTPACETDNAKKKRVSRLFG